MQSMLQVVIQPLDQFSSAFELTKEIHLQGSQDLVPGSAIAALKPKSIERHANAAGPALSVFAILLLLIILGGIGL